MDDAKLTPEELEEMEKIVHMVLPYFTAVNIQYV